MVVWKTTRCGIRRGYSYEDFTTAQYTRKFSTQEIIELRKEYVQNLMTCVYKFFEENYDELVRVARRYVRDYAHDLYTI